MDDLKKKVSDMNRSISTADHLAYITFPVVNDIKLLLHITRSVDEAMTNGMDILLEYDRMYKRIGPLPSNFNSRFDVFKKACVKRYNISEDHVDLINELRDIMRRHKESPMEFKRKDEFVICNDHFRLKKLSIQRVKGYLEKAKPFISQVNNIINK